MREHKYKGWDGKKILPAQDLTQNGKCWEWLGKFDVELIQFTGMYDWRGNEIYEGAIVTVHHEYDEDCKTICKVRYNAFGEYPAFDLYNKTSRTRSGLENYSQEFNSFSCPEYTIEVIGNIYENPELLE